MESFLAVLLLRDCFGLQNRPRNDFLIRRSILRYEYKIGKKLIEKHDLFKTQELSFAEKGQLLQIGYEFVIINQIIFFSLRIINHV